MASARTIGISTTVKIARRIDLSISTAIPQSTHRKKNRYAVKHWRGLCQWSSNKYGPIHYKKNRFSTNTNTHHDVPPEIGLTVDLSDLLSTPERDFLIRNNNGQKVPISSLKGKLVGLYFCNNISDPHRIDAIKKVYEEAKSCGYDFEIVQITLHYHSFETRDLGTDPTVNWLTVPFMDPSCRKIQRIFECVDDENKYWYDGDCLVMIHPCQVEDDDTSGVLFEFSGAEILERWGIEGYPFTRPSLYKAEYEVQKREITLQSLFPPGECLLRPPLSAGDGSDLVDAASQLSGKRVLVLFAHHDDNKNFHRAFGDNFISMLKSKYEAQVEESKFEVVYVSTAYYESSFDEFIKDMPWFVRPFSKTGMLFLGSLTDIFKTHFWGATEPAAVAFNEQGELIAKEDRIDPEKEVDKIRFPFIDQDLEKFIRGDVERLCPSIQCKKNHDLSTAVKQCNNSDLSIAVKQCRVKGLPFSKKDRYKVCEIGYTVDVAELLFTPERDFLVKNNGQKIKVDDLRGKTIVLFIVPLDKYYWNGYVVDVIDAYCELQRVGSVVEFVFVPAQLHSSESVDEREEAIFDKLFSTMPFPAIPFSDIQGPEDPVVHTFSVDDDSVRYHGLPYWVIIDPTNTVVATRYFHRRLFKLFGGAELHPLSRERILSLEACYESEPRRWDELLTSDTRDFLLSSNGDKVPISSLYGRLIGLYFCENIPDPPHMKAIKKVYEEAKSRGYDFEIVQITFHYYPVNAEHLDTDPTIQQCSEDTSWLSLPFKDPSCRKIQRIILGSRCWGEDEEEDKLWFGGDSLVLIKDEEEEEDEDENDEDEDENEYEDEDEDEEEEEDEDENEEDEDENEYEDEDEADYNSEGLYEFFGAEILERWGIEGYPFTRPSLYKAEYELQKREIIVQSLFPPGECLLRRHHNAGDEFDLVDAASQLSGKRVLILFAPHDDEHRAFGSNFLSMLKCEYDAQVEESKFEVVYVSTGDNVSSFDKFTEDMPWWLVRPLSEESRRDLYKVFKGLPREPCAAAFNEQGELIAKEGYLREKKECDKLRFPFIDQDLEKFIRGEVEDIVRYQLN